MDVQSFISVIFEKPALWDQKNRNHHNRFVLDKLWDEVAVELKTTRTKARSKWKSLRDKFRTTLAAIPKSKSGDEDSSTFQSSWQYFESLMFLKDQFTPRKSSGNLETPSNLSQEVIDKNYNIEEDDPSSEYTENSNSAVFSDSTSSTIRPSTSSNELIQKTRKRRIANDIGSELLEIERIKMKYLEHKSRQKTDDDEEDLNFFKSILPNIKNFNPIQKMAYRTKILQVTQEFLQQSPTNAPFNFPAHNAIFLDDQVVKRDPAEPDYDLD